MRWSDPTKERLLARIAELEKQSSGEESRNLESSWVRRGRERLRALGRFPVTLYFSS